MKKANRRCLTLVLAFAALSAGPVAAGPTQELIELTALADELAYDIRQSRQVLLQDCSASEWCRVYGQIVVEAIEDAGQNLRLGPLAVSAIGEMFGQMEEQDRQDLLEFFKSSIGRRIVELQVASRAPSFLDQVEVDGESYYQELADEEARYSLIEAIDSVGDGSAIQRNLGRTGSRIAEWVAERAKASGEEPLTTTSKAAERSRHAYHLRLSLTYKPISDEELQAYVEFLESSGGEIWSNTHREIRSRAVREAAKPIMQRLVTRLGGGE